MIEWVTYNGEGGHHRISQQELKAILKESVLLPGEPEPLGEKQYLIVARRS